MIGLVTCANRRPPWHDWLNGLELEAWLEVSNQSIMKFWPRNLYGHATVRGYDLLSAESMLGWQGLWVIRIVQTCMPWERVPRPIQPEMACHDLSFLCSLG